jgi:iron(III) transport system permease protein
MSLLVSLIVLTIVLLLVYPLGMTITRAFVDPSLGAGTFLSSLTDPGLAEVLRNTFLLVVAAGTLALTISALLAWVNERTDAGLGLMGELLPLVPLLIPPLAGVSGWVVLFDPRVGLVNGAIRAALSPFGISFSRGPLDVYTMGGLILVSAVYLVPFAYLVLCAAFRRLDPALEEASRIHGGGPLGTFLRVTLPSVAPAIGAAGLLTVIVGVALFSVPIVIGTGARIDVLSVRIYRLVNNFPPNIGAALLLALIMVAIVQLLLVVQRRLTRTGQYAVIGGRGFHAARMRLGRWRPWVRLACVTYLVVTAVLPLLALILVSFQPFWSPVIDWQKLTSGNYQSVLFENRSTAQALLTSLTLGVVGATIGMLLAGLLMLHVHSGRPAGKRIVDTVTALPATIPHTVIAVGFLIAFISGPLPLYGTPTLLLLAYLLLFMPFAARAASAAASEVGAELNEASRVFGASERRTFSHILVPLSLPGLAAGWIMLFVFMVGELTASALLSGTANPVVGRVLLDLWSSGSFPQLAAMALIMALINGLFVLAMLRFTRRSFEVTVS